MRELFFRPPGLARLPLNYPWLAPWAEFLRRFAARNARLVPPHNKNPVRTRAVKALPRIDLFSWPSNGRSSMSFLIRVGDARSYRLLES